MSSSPLFLDRDKNIPVNIVITIQYFKHLNLISSQSDGTGEESRTFDDKRWREARVNVTERKSITGMMTGRKVLRRKKMGKKQQRRRQGKCQQPARCKPEELYWGSDWGGGGLWEHIFMGDYILRNTDKTLNKAEDVVVCLPGGG